MEEIILTEKNLIQFLSEHSLNPLFEKESNLPYILIKIYQNELPLFFSIRNNGEVLQLIIYLPYKIIKTHLNDTSRLLHILNKDLDLPGFNLDEDEGLIFYRLVMPCIDKKLNTKILIAYINSIQLVCDSFSQAIGLVASGQMDIETLKNMDLPKNK